MHDVALSKFGVFDLFLLLSGRPESFRGHYVVVVEYDVVHASVRVMDPASNEGMYLALDMNNI